MDVTSILQNLGTDYASKIRGTAAPGMGNAQQTDSVFDSIYQSALGLLNDTNTYVQEAQQAEVDFALGKLTSTHELGAIQQKANLSLQYTVGIRDRLLDAYREIMNMTV